MQTLKSEKSQDYQNASNVSGLDNVPRIRELQASIDRRKASLVVCREEQRVVDEQIRQLSIMSYHRGLLEVQRQVKALQDAQIRRSGLQSLIEEGLLKLSFLESKLASEKANTLVVSEKLDIDVGEPARLAPFETLEKEDDAGILVNEQQFYCFFLEDLETAKLSVEILCPFVHTRRISILEKLVELQNRGGKAIIYTRPPKDDESTAFFGKAGDLKIEIIQRAKLHHKVAIIDGEICWEGSLNILSHGSSLDSMRRLVGKRIAEAHRKLYRLRRLTAD